MVYRLFFIWSFISTLWRHLFSLNYHIVIVHVRLYIWRFLLPNWGNVLQVSTWLGKNCGSTCFQSQHLCLKSWKCSRRSFCLVTLLSFMSGFLEHFLTLPHGEWDQASSRASPLRISLRVNGLGDGGAKPSSVSELPALSPQVQQQVSLLPLRRRHVHGGLHPGAGRPPRGEHLVWFLHWRVCACGFQLPFQ